MSEIAAYLSVGQQVQLSSTELFGGSHSSYVSSEHFTWLPLLAVVYCTSFVNRIRFMRGVPETNWNLYCLARHQRPASIRQQNSWNCLVDENSLPNSLCSFTGTCHDPALITQPMLASPELILGAHLITGSVQMGLEKGEGWRSHRGAHKELAWLSRT